MVSTAIEPTARNSDCQFCSVVSQKSALPRYCSQLRGSASCSIWSALYVLQPVTEWANHEPIQIVPMTIRSEFEYRNSLMPRVFAHFGEEACACSPIFWSRSDSRPTLSGSFDSGDPFCTNQTVATMKSVNCRYSDCQFSITAWPNA